MAALRARDKPPFLDGWTLYVEGEPPYEVSPADHDVARRTELAAADGLGLALVSLSAPLGVEWLPAEEARPLLDAYHEDAAGLPEPFGAWAAACVRDIDADATAAVLDRGFAGLQLPANALADAAGYARCAPLLDLLEARGLPLFVHPGPATGESSAPGWWPALVPYVQQMHAAWFAFRAFGRPRHPRLRVCFALLAGLAPLHGERFAARGGGLGRGGPGRVRGDVLVRSARRRRGRPCPRCRCRRPGHGPALRGAAAASRLRTGRRRGARLPGRQSTAPAHRKGLTAPRSRPPPGPSGWPPRIRRPRNGPRPGRGRSRTPGGSCVPRVRCRPRPR